MNDSIEHDCYNEKYDHVQTRHTRYNHVNSFRKYRSEFQKNLKPDMWIDEVEKHGHKNNSSPNILSFKRYKIDKIMKRDKIVFNLLLYFCPFALDFANFVSFK
jgi:hypothetical protein